MANGLTLNCCNRMLSSFLHKENASNKAVQITLVAIAIIGVSLFAASYYPVINATLGYYAIGIAVVSLVSLIIFRSYSSSELDRAIDACKSFSEIEEIFTKSTTKVSLFGVRQLTSIGIRGSSTLDHLAIKIEKETALHLIVEPKFSRGMTTGKTFKYTAEESRSLDQLVDPIFDLFNELDKKIDKESVITRMCYWTPRFFKRMVSYNDIRSRYKGNSEGMRGTAGPEYDTRAKGKDNMPPRFGYID